MNNETKGMILGFCGISAFGLTLPMTRMVVPYLDPVFIGLGRAVVAALFSGVILLLLKVKMPTKSQFFQLIIVALGVVIGFPILSATAMRFVPAAHGGVVIGILPLLTAIVGTFISKSRPSIGFWLTGFAGSALVVTFSLLDSSGQFQWGDLILLAASLAAAIGYAVGGHLSKEMEGWQVICWALILALPFISIPAYLHAPETISAIPVNIWMGFLYLALISQLGGFFLWYKGLALGGVARVSQAQLFQPFVTIGASALMLGETINLVTIVFALLIMSIVAISKKMPIHQNTVAKSAPV